MASDEKHRPALSKFAVLCILATLTLIFAGGLVTSKQAGLAVPDWPLSYGSVNPPGWWQIENVRLEHGHRLIGAAIGLLTTTLAVWVFIADKRSWVRMLGVAAFAGVSVQGVMGGLRVTERSTFLAIVHGCTAHLFLAVLVVLAVATSGMSRQVANVCERAALPGIRNAALLMGIVVFVQLILGAVMRHFQAGLAIPDFPLAFGRLIPPMATFEIAIHFAHRVGAFAVAVSAGWMLWRAVRGSEGDPRILFPAAAAALLTLVQIGLGASIIWLAKPPVPTTFHVVNGAVILAAIVALAARASILERSNPGHAEAIPNGSGGSREVAAS